MLDGWNVEFWKSAFAKFQSGRLLPVAQPFEKNNAVCGIEEFFLKRCFLLAGICIREGLPLFQNRNDPALPRRQKIADLARIKECHGVFDRGQLRRFVLLFLALILFVAFGLWFFLVDQRKWRELLRLSARLLDRRFKRLARLRGFAELIDHLCTLR